MVASSSVCPDEARAVNTNANAAMPLQRDAAGIGLVLLSGLGVVFLPTTAKLAYLDGSNVFTVAFARGVIAIVLLALVAMALRLSLRMPRRLLRSSLVAGAGQACFVYGVYASIETINISLALLILYLYPIVLALHQHLLGVVRVRPVQWLCALTTCAGFALILGVGFEQISLAGIALALMAMIATVIITLTNVTVTATLGSLVSNFYMSLWSLIIFLLALIAVGPLQLPQSGVGWAALSGNGIAYCIAWVSFFAGARILGATRASMLTLVEPPAAALAAWLLFGEFYTPLQWLGFFVVLAALYGFERLARANA